MSEKIVTLQILKDNIRKQNIILSEAEINAIIRGCDLACMENDIPLEKEKVLLFEDELRKRNKAKILCRQVSSILTAASFSILLEKAQRLKEFDYEETKNVIKKIAERMCDVLKQRVHGLTLRNNEAQTLAEIEAIMQEERNLLQLEYFLSAKAMEKLCERAEAEELHIFIGAAEALSSLSRKKICSFFEEKIQEYKWEIQDALSIEECIIILKQINPIVVEGRSLAEISKTFFEEDDEELHNVKEDSLSLLTIASEKICEVVDSKIESYRNEMRCAERIAQVERILKSTNPLIIEGYTREDLEEYMESEEAREELRAAFDMRSTLVDDAEERKDQILAFVEGSIEEAVLPDLYIFEELVSSTTDNTKSLEIKKKIRNRIEEGEKERDKEMPLLEGYSTECKSRYFEVKERGISRLCHLTPVENISSIFSSEEGILSRQKMPETMSALRPDGECWDRHPELISCSIQYPSQSYNYLKAVNGAYRLAAILVSKDVIWKHEKTMFCPINAATKKGDDYGGYIGKSLSSVYAWRFFERDFSYHPWVPYDYRAEVMPFSNIPKRYLTGIVFPNDDLLQECREEMELKGISYPNLYVSSDMFGNWFWKYEATGQLPEEKLISRGTYHGNETDI